MKGGALDEITVPRYSHSLSFVHIWPSAVDVVNKLKLGSRSATRASHRSEKQALRNTALNVAKIAVRSSAKTERIVGRVTKRRQDDKRH